MFLLRSPKSSVFRLHDRRLIITTLRSSSSSYKIISEYTSPIRKCSTENCTHYHVPKRHFGTRSEDSNKKKKKTLNSTLKFMSPFEVVKREDIYNIPNLLSLSRLLITPAIGYFITQANFTWAMSSLAVASLTDLFDGYIARKYNKKTALGSVLDPLADKVLITTLTISLSISGHIPVYLAGLIVGRDVALVSYVSLLRYRSLSKPVTLSKYFDASLPSVQLQPTLISKWNTVFQLALLGSTLAAPAVFGIQDHPFLYFMRQVVTGTTVVSGASYMFKKDTFRLLIRKRKRRNKG